MVGHSRHVCENRSGDDSLWHVGSVTHFEWHIALAEGIFSFNMPDRTVGSPDYQGEGGGEELAFTGQNFSS